MKKKRTQIGKYKTVFEGKFFTVKQAKAKLPSGKTETYERVERPPSVLVLAIDSKKRLLLTREYRIRRRKYEWRLPAGRVDMGASPKAAAQRELREETGFKAKKLELFHLSVGGNSLDWKRYTYIAKDLAEAPLEGDEDEDITVVPTPISKAHRLVLDGKINNELIAYVILKLYRERKKYF